jgi:hypothetical protein
MNEALEHYAALGFVALILLIVIVAAVCDALDRSEARR